MPPLAGRTPDPGNADRAADVELHDDIAAEPRLDSPAVSPLATLLLVTYNHEHLVHGALESAFRQTYHPLEILISDDASTDRTFERACDIAGRYNGPHRVILNRNAERQRHGHLNAVMPMVGGEVVVLACGDDLSEPERVATVMRARKDTGAAVLGSNCTRIDRDGQPFGLLIDPAADQDVSLDRFLDGPTVVCHGASLAWTTDLWEEFGPIEGIRVIDSIIPFWGLLRSSNHYIPTPLVRYRFHDANTALGILAHRAESAEERCRIAEVRAHQRVANTLAMLRVTERYKQRNPDDPRIDFIGQRLAARLRRDAEAWVRSRHELPDAGIGFY